MKAVAAASISDYEQAVTAVGDYYAAVEQGLGACFRDPDLQSTDTAAFTRPTPICVIVFGTDQGLVGQFNDTVANFTLGFLDLLKGSETQYPRRSANHSAAYSAAPLALIWVVGERLSERLSDAGLTLQGRFNVPNSVKAITPLIGNILLSLEALTPLSAQTKLHLIYSRPGNAPSYSPVSQGLLPLDKPWRKNLIEKAWPGRCIPQLLGSKTTTLGALIHEYLFVSLFRASAESLSSENASRLSAMQRADKNIEELLETLGRDYHRLRQAGIDEEMFDVIAAGNF